jgi:hypothetical protein
MVQKISPYLSQAGRYRGGGDPPKLANGHGHMGRRALGAVLLRRKCAHAHVRDSVGWRLQAQEQQAQTLLGPGHTYVLCNAKGHKWCWCWCWCSGVCAGAETEAWLAALVWNLPLIPSQTCCQPAAPLPTSRLPTQHPFATAPTARTPPTRRTPPSSAFSTDLNHVETIATPSGGLHGAR